MRIFNLKRFIITLSIVIFTITASAQTLRFKTQAYSQRDMFYGMWAEWSNWESSNMSITMDLDSDLITIYSPRVQYYKITQYVGNYIDNGASIAEYKMIDQDGDRGTLLLVIKADGQSEIYIKFANIQWAYVVVRI